MTTPGGASLRRWLLGLPPSEWALRHLRDLIINTLKCGPIPRHVAFVMDGNRRYAREHHLETVQGHHLGFEALARILEVCYKSGVKVVTIYAFSIENFKRSKYEVDGLMDMAKTRLVQMSQHGELFERYGCQVRILGDRSLVREDVLEQVDRAVDMTKGNGRAVLNVCFPYTSREEITTSIRDTVEEFSVERDRRRSRLKRGFSETHVLRNLRSRQLSSVAEEVSPIKEDAHLPGLDDGASTEASSVQDLEESSSTLHQPPSSHTSHSPSPTLKPTTDLPQRQQPRHLPDPETLTVEHLDKHTYTYPAPPLDLLIRTSGVFRLSDFMLWQCHENTEVKFLDCLWPEFDLWNFLPVLVEWQWRQRREGGAETLHSEYTTGHDEPQPKKSIFGRIKDELKENKAAHDAARKNFNDNGPYMLVKDSATGKEVLRSNPNWPNEGSSERENRGLTVRKGDKDLPDFAKQQRGK